MVFPKCKQLVAIFAVQVLFAGTAFGDELTRKTWDIPTHEQVVVELQGWLAENDISEELAARILADWEKPIPAAERLNALAASIAAASSEGKKLVDFCRSMRNLPTLPQFEFLESSETLPFVRNHLRLVLARWLAQNQLYDETLETLQDMEPNDVADPASLLFYRGIALHRLLKKDECIPVVEQLLEREEDVPRRFATLAKMIQADIGPLKEDSLDEISRLMDSIQVRLGHGRAGKRVRTEEDDVIEKLDKMIKELEDQAKQQQQQASASGKAGDTLNPSKPMEDSMPGGASGPGNVDAKEISQKSGWGDLPPKERQQTLQQLGKEFPSHYRDVIEEYFRKLAQEGADR